MIVSISKCKSIVVYDLYGVCLQTSVSFVCDLKGSYPHVACGVHHVGRCSTLKIF